MTQNDSNFPGLPGHRDAPALTLLQISHIVGAGRLRHLDDKALSAVALTVIEARMVAGKGEQPKDPALLVLRDAVWKERGIRATNGEQAAARNRTITSALNETVVRDGQVASERVQPEDDEKRGHGAMLVAGDRLWFVPVQHVGGDVSVGAAREVRASATAPELPRLLTNTEAFRTDLVASTDIAFRPAHPGREIGPIELTDAHFTKLLEGDEERSVRIAVAAAMRDSARTAQAMHLKRASELRF